MAVLEYSSRPVLNRSILITALSGWPDAAEGATGAVRELVRLLPAARFASIDPEEFYDFGRQRPLVSTGPDGTRKITWVSNEFFFWRSGDHGRTGDRDIVVLLGAEPHSRWRTYRDAVMEVALECRVELLLVVGSLLAQTPHSRPARVMGSASRPDLGPGFEHIRFSPSGYQGPTSMTSVLMEAAGQQGIPSASLWGQCPHYVQVAQNPAISHALLREVQSFLPVKLDLAQLAREAEQFNAGLARALEGQRDITAYVKRLEEEYDNDAIRTGTGRQEPLDPGELVKDLEEFLRSQRRQSPGNQGEDKR